MLRMSQYLIPHATNEIIVCYLGLFVGRLLLAICDRVVSGYLRDDLLVISGMIVIIYFGEIDYW